MPINVSRQLLIVECVIVNVTIDRHTYRLFREDAKSFPPGQQQQVNRISDREVEKLESGKVIDSRESISNIKKEIDSRKSISA